MTDPLDSQDITAGLHRFGAAVAQHAQPPPVADIRRRAQRRRRGQLAVIAAASAVVLLGGGAAIGNSGLLDDRTGRPVGPAVSTESTSEPTPTSTTTTTTFGSKRYDAIPADYPLLSFVDDPGGDGTIDGPAQTVPGARFSPCGQGAWDPRGSVDQLAVRSNIPENVQIRQIVLFDDQAAAQDSIDHVRDTFEACPVEQSDQSFGMLHEISVPSPDDGVPSAVGQSSLGVSSRSTYDQDPALAVGLTEMRWVRIANAVFFTYDTSEAMGDDTRPGREADQRAGQMVQAWCESAGGC